MASSNAIEPSQLYAQKHMGSVVAGIEFDAVLHLPKSEIVLSGESWACPDRD